MLDQETLEDFVAKVVEDRRGKYLSRSNNPDSLEGNAEKRQRLSSTEARTQELESALCFLHEKLEGLKKQKMLQARMEQAAAPSANANAAIEAQMKRKNGPLTRLTITSDVFHKNNPHIAKTLFGYKTPRNRKDLQDDAQQPISSWEFTKRIISVNFGLEHNEPTLESIRHSDGRSTTLSPFEETILTLLWKKNKFDPEFLATLFGVHQDQIDETITRWAPLFDKSKGFLNMLPNTSGR